MNKTRILPAVAALVIALLVTLVVTTDLVPGIGNSSPDHKGAGTEDQNPADKGVLLKDESLRGESLDVGLLDSNVNLLRVPDGGIQPRARTDSAGTTHLVYFLLNQDAAAGTREQSGHLYYRQLAAGAKHWSAAIQVSTAAYEHNDAIGKASIAVDATGRVHVTWLELSPVRFQYTRSNQQQTDFEQPRSLVSTHLLGIEAEPALAVSGTQVAITWHAGDMLDEASRAVYARASSDAGATFGPEQQLSDPSLGACACCGLAAAYQPDETLLVAYRSAIDSSGRHMQLLQGAPGQRQTAMLDAWELNACPVTSNQFAQSQPQASIQNTPQPSIQNTPQALWLTFETRGEIRLYDVNGGQVGGVRAAAGGLRQKHPALAVNSNGQRLLAWGEGNGYKSGGTLNWQLFNPAAETKSGTEGGTKGGTKGEAADKAPEAGTKPDRQLRIPDYSVVAVAPRNNNSFLLIY